MKRIFRFQYFTSVHFPLLHQARDTTIFLEVINLFLKHGFSYEDTFMNYPKMKDKTQFVFDFHEDDLVVLTTRPPLSDKYQRRTIYQSGHELEVKMLILINSCFISLSRQVMYLTKELSAHLPRRFQNRASIEFYVQQNKTSKPAGYKQVARYENGIDRGWVKWSKPDHPRPAKSCAFLIFFKASQFLPFKLMFIFGLGGEEGLIFSRILRNGLWEKLNIDFEGPSRFVMVEFDVAIPEFPTNLDFVKGLQYDVILDVFLKDLPA